MGIKQKILKDVLVFSLMLWTIPICATTYEDAEDNATTGWVIYGDTIDASVINVEDSERCSRVIQLIGNGKETGYRLGNRNGRGETDAWNNTTEKQLQWSMKYDEPFRIYVSILTKNGNRYLTYTNHSDDMQGIIRGGKVQYGLGADSIDGTWHTFTRDLESDWNAFVHDNPILSINGFFIRGSGRVDDILLSSVSHENQLPIANAGVDKAVEESTVVALDGSGSSDPDGDSLTYLWTMVSKPAGSNAVLSNATVVNPTFVADEIGDYEFQLVVNDGQVDSLPDTVIISANMIRNKVLSVCDIWSVANSGGSAGTFDSWDISDIPQGATFDFEFEAYYVPDKFKVTYPVGNVVLDSGWRGGYAPNGEVLAGPGTLHSYSLFTKGASDTMTVQVSGEQPGTAWNYRVRCVEHPQE